MVFVRALLLLCTLLLSPSGAAERSSGPLPAYLSNLACRIASRMPSPDMAIRTLVDVNIDTMSDLQARRTLSAQLHNGRTLTAIVQHVYIRMPRDRFNITLLLDGKPHLRQNHVDLEIFTETTIDGRAYLLHCFPDLAPAPAVDNTVR